MSAHVPANQVVSAGIDGVSAKQPEIVHAQWAGFGASTNDAFSLDQHVFLNPDTNSNIAAILVNVLHDASRGNGIRIYAINKPETRQKNTDSFKREGIEVSDYNCNPPTEEALDALSIARDGEWHSTISLGEFHWIENERGALVKNGRKIMKVLGESAIISENPQIRDAMVSAIAEQFVSFKMLAGPVDQLERK